jgi:tRNA(Ile)-lysidine synthase
MRKIEDVERASVSIETDRALACVRQVLERTRSEEIPVGDSEAAELFAPLEQARGLLLAVSGGPDSTAMMVLFARWQPASRPPIHVATVDHGLRAQARAEAKAVAAAAKRLGLSHRILAWSGVKPATRLQERARQARYDLLVRHAKAIGASHIVLAHHADDQAETVLFRLLRGSGPAGLAGMAGETARDGVMLARPFLSIPKARLLATCAAAGLGFVDDPSNAEPRFARVRLRRLMPLLEKEGLDRAHLLRLAERAGRAEAALRHTAYAVRARLKVAFRAEGLRVDASALAEVPREIAVRVVAGLIAEAGAAEPPRLERLEALSERLIAALKAGKPLKGSLAGCVLSLDHQGKVVIVREKPRRRGNRRVR